MNVLLLNEIFFFVNGEIVLININNDGKLSFWIVLIGYIDIFLF